MSAADLDHAETILRAVERAIAANRRSVWITTPTASFSCRVSRVDMTAGRRRAVIVFRRPGLRPRDERIAACLVTRLDMFDGATFSAVEA